MSHRADPETCELLGSLLSAQRDGELDPAEMETVNRYLETSPSCRQTLAAFAQIDELVFAVSSPREPACEPANECGPGGPYRVDQSRASQLRTKFFTRGGSLAAAALVLIALTLTAIPPDSSVTGDQIALPLTELEWISDEQEASQARLLKTMELELRALKLQLANLDVPTDPDADFAEENQRIRAKLNALIDKVHQFTKTES